MTINRKLMVRFTHHQYGLEAAPIRCSKREQKNQDQFAGLLVRVQSGEHNSRSVALSSLRGDKLSRQSIVMPLVEGLLLLSALPGLGGSAPLAVGRLVVALAAVSVSSVAGS